MASHLNCPRTCCSRDAEAKQSDTGKTKSSRLHVLTHEPETITPAKAPSNLSTRSKIPKRNPSKEERGPSNQEWEHFRGSWRRHTKYWGLVQEKELVYNLWQCLSLS